MLRSMQVSRLLTILAALGLLGAWLGLFFRYFFSAESAARVPVAAIAVLLVMAVAAALMRRRATPRSVSMALALTAASFVFFQARPGDDERLQAPWRREASQRVAETLRAVGEDVAHLEEVSTAMAAPVAAYVARAGESVASDRTTAFALLH